MTAHLLTNDSFNSDDYRNQEVPAAAIARLLTAGFKKKDAQPFALFTGGGNGCGKSTFLQKPLADELRQNDYNPRNIQLFYEEVCNLCEQEGMFATVRDDSGKTPAIRGQRTWQALTSRFPELKAIETYPVPLVNMDLVAYLLNECIEHQQSNPDFLVRDHYYRALNAAPALCEALTQTGHSFVVDSTMSNPSKIIKAAGTVAQHGYNLNYAIFYADNAISRVMERAKSEGRKITHADATRSQQKMPANFWEFVSSAQQNGAFLGLYDTSTGKDTLIAHNGQKPTFTCLDSETAIYQAPTLSDKGRLPRLIACNPEHYAQFRFGTETNRR